MSVYNIMLGTKRLDKVPKEVRWEWGELVARLKNVTYSEHTMEQYQKMGKAQRVNVKDIGFFIGGMANKRKVIFKQILSLDIDEVEADTLDNLRQWLKGKQYVLHSTHSSTPEEPRYRVVTPLSRIVSADEHGAIMHLLHDKFKLPLDVATLDFNRIMFLPSVPKDAKYFFEEGNGETLNVDDILESVSDWKDLSDVPVPKNTQVQDPKFKGGIIGAFCAKVSIHEALDLYLTDVWRKERTGCYTLIGASTTSGGKIYEEKYFFSNHSTDPYLGRSHNAYDAVRLYKFGEGKSGEAAMLAFCESLGIRPDSGKAHSLTIEGFDDEDAKTILQERLLIDKNGNLIKSLKNAEIIMEYDPNLAGLFGEDLFSSSVVLKRTPIWRTLDEIIVGEDCKDVQSYREMSDVDESYLRLYFEERYEFDARASLTDALNISAHKNAFHPVRDYLNSLVWDGKPRLETIFIDCFGVKDTLYAREVGLKFFVGAVRRVFIPASKMDYIPVLVSEEGLGKSMFIRRMAKLWGSDTFYTFNGSKEAYEQLRGVWIMEIPELNGVQSKSTNSRKAFVTKGEDKYRSAYLKYSKTYKRQCVFIASSNDVVFLDDPNEDGRRWWGLLCNPDNVTIDVKKEEFLDLVNHYWAEAVYWYLQDVKPMLSPQAEAEAKLMRQIHKSEDLEMGALLDYLNMPVPPDWRKNTYYAHKIYWEDQREIWSGSPRNEICNVEVAREFFGYDRKDINVAVGKRVSDAIERTGLFYRDGTKRSFGEYGGALAWIRKEPIKEIKVEKEVKPKKKK